MAHSRKVTSKDRNDAATVHPYLAVSRQSLRSRLLRLVRSMDTPPVPRPRKPAFEPYEDFDILLTAGHNIG
jgi:hypothetical protein